MAAMADSTAMTSLALRPETKLSRSDHTGPSRSLTAQSSTARTVDCAGLRRTRKDGRQFEQVAVAPVVVTARALICSAPISSAVLSNCRCELRFLLVL